MNSESLLFEAVDIISLTTLNGTFYGLELALYCLCSRLLCRQLWDSQQGFRKGTALSFALASLAMICTTIVMVLGTRTIQLAYIDHSGAPGGPLAYEVSAIWREPIGYVVNITTLIVDLLAQGVQIWRLWVVWSGTKFNVAITLLPLILFFAYAGIDIVLIIFQNQFSSQGSIIVADLTLELLITIPVTILVIVRLMLVRRSNIKIIGNPETAAQYLSIVAMLTESYALDSALSIALAISFAIKSASAFTLLNRCSTHIKAIAYLLVVYRVALGRAWNAQTNRQISSLRFGGDGPNQSEFGETTTARIAQVQESSLVTGLPPSMLRSNV